MTEQELRTSITPCIMAGNTWFVFDEIKAYAGAQVEASVARQQPIFEAAMNAKNTEIAELKAQVEGLKTDMQHSRLIEAAQVKESNELKAEIKRLREGIQDAVDWLNNPDDNVDFDELLQSLLSPAPVTHQPDILTKILALPDDTSAAYIKALIHDLLKTK